MSERYPGGYITKNAPQPTGGESGVADGVWTLEQALEYKQAGNWPIPVQPVYIEDVFSTYLYTGNGSTQTITNGINLSGKGGLAWIKTRNAAESHFLVDSARGAFKLETNNTNAQGSQSLLTLSSSGFNLLLGNVAVNGSGTTYASWSFRKAEKFFDVVTYTGNGASARFINHNLGSAPGFIVVKRTDSTSDWYCYHTATTGIDNYLLLNSTAAKTFSAEFWGQGSPNTTQFGISSTINVNGGTYVAYLFAHDAGGFGINGTDNVISCGSFDINVSGTATVNLGWEPQFVLIKSTEASSSWSMFDNMRGMPIVNNVARLMPNASNSESYISDYIARPTSTGFVATATGFNDPAYNGFIYIAIRRGPMKTPTDATKVFIPITYTGPALNTTSNVTTGFPVDSLWCGAKNYPDTVKTLIQDRLRIQNNTTTSNTLVTSGTYNENAINSYVTINLANNTGYSIRDSNGSWNGDSSGGYNPYAWAFRRAPGFFDTVCYSGTSSGMTVNHNLGVVPELIIVKGRTNSFNWPVFCSAFAPSLPAAFTFFLNTTDAVAGISFWNDTAPTSTVFSVSASGAVNTSGQNYVAYLFASCPGVSKVGAYTGNGSTSGPVVDCGFASGPRYLIIKRASDTGPWYVYDTARGFTSGNEQVLLLNTDGAEFTANQVNPTATGFQVVTDNVNLNASGNTYIYLAIA